MSYRSSSPVSSRSTRSSLSPSPSPKTSSKQGIPSPKHANILQKRIQRRSSLSIAETSIQDTTADGLEEDLQDFREWREEELDLETPLNKKVKGKKTSLLVTSRRVETSESSSTEDLQNDQLKRGKARVQVKKVVKTQPVKSPKEPSKEPAKQSVKPIAAKPPTIPPPAPPPAKIPPPHQRKPPKAKFNPLVAFSFLILLLLVSLKIVLDTSGKVDKLYFILLQTFSDLTTNIGDGLDKIWFRILEALS